MTKRNPYLAIKTLDNGMVMKLDFFAIKTFHKLTGVNLLEENNADVSLTPEVLEAFYYSVLKREQDEITLDEAGDMVFMYPEAFAELMGAANTTEAEVKAVTGPEVKKKSTGKA